ncbi:hypothetical protein Gotri_017773 [Gossypium trilobum]|uniref:Uncharacterized protein n=1 Tax=Gossypium trilobum TaxID=34281 RepID=A0A7J9E8Y4_9ROSI|nr:hypothetical protein [Gossypium trilobum]
MEAKPSKKDLYTSYLHINPKEASLFDTFSVLFSRNVKKRKFIESSLEELESFLYRLLIVISVLIQKFLLKLSMPMAMIGRTIVFLLNFFYINGGFFGLIRNIMQVRVVIPDKKAATYLSFVGFTDTRMELDINIKYGNAMYYPALSIMACKAAYNNAAYNQALIEGQWKMEFLGYKDYWNGIRLPLGLQYN